ncbi:MAG: nicotinate phosphoribosyltransferase [Clostridiales bacterium]|nr:nicotinate phosphoribosyltransferase [Clostridiales bacterium]
MRERIENLDAVSELRVEKDRPLFSATHQEILAGATTDIYFVKTLQILDHMGLAAKEAQAEIFARKPGVFAGLPEAISLLKGRNAQVWALPEGERFKEKEVLMRISGPYAQYGALETPLLGILASSSGWATAAAEIVEAAGDSPVTVFGARHVHPAVAPVMERSAIIGGVGSASCILGAKLAGAEPVGTAPHALFLIAGDTVAAALAYDECMPKNSARLILVDTFKDEAEESLRVAKAMGGHLAGVRLDTPSERGGVGIELVREVRARLDRAGYQQVKVFVSGGLTPERLRLLKEAGAAAFGVGSYISGARPIDMTMDIKQVAGVDVAKRGRIPGITENSRLLRVM